MYCRKCYKVCWIVDKSPVNGKRDYYCQPCNINQSEEWVGYKKIKFTPCKGNCGIFLEIKPREAKYGLYPYTVCDGFIRRDGEEPRPCKAGSQRKQPYTFVPSGPRSGWSAR